MYVFDKRMALAFSDKSKDIGKCIHCRGTTSNYENCALSSCNQLILICETCLDKQSVTCGPDCAKKVDKTAVA